MKTLLLIDAHALIHRAFHALPSNLMTKNGQLTGAIYGFFLMLQKSLTDFDPSHLVVAFDTPVNTFRKKMYKDYQSKRPPMDTGLKDQIPYIKKLLDLGGIVRIEKAKYEADDVIGSLVKKFKKDFNRILILSGDRDLLQLVDDNVFMVAPKNGLTNFQLFSLKEVLDAYGVLPQNIPDYKALVGDASDNYLTAKGIGPKTARLLLKDTITIENLLLNINKLENKRWQEILLKYDKQILLFKKLATIICTLNLKLKNTDIKFLGFNDKIIKELQKLELYSLINKLFNQKKEIPTNKNKVEEPKKSSQQINLFE